MLRAAALLLLSVAVLAACAQNAPVSPTAEEPVSAPQEEIRVISFDESQIYSSEQQTVAAEPVDSSDIATILASNDAESGLELMFYTARDGVIYGAYRESQDADWLRFLTEDTTTYEDSGGYGFQPFDNVLGHSGFVVLAPRGAAYFANDYYYFDADGALKLLVAAAETVIENDFDGDGTKEIAQFYHGGRDTSYFFERDGELLCFYLTDALRDAFPEWENVYANPFDTNGAEFTVFYKLADEDDEDDEHSVRVTLSKDAMTVHIG
jgi:hypothetical protein